MGNKCSDLIGRGFIHPRPEIAIVNTSAYQIGPFLFHRTHSIEKKLSKARPQSANRSTDQPNVIICARIFDEDAIHLGRQQEGQAVNHTRATGSIYTMRKLEPSWHRVSTVLWFPFDAVLAYSKPIKSAAGQTKTGSGRP